MGATTDRHRGVTDKYWEKALTTSLFYNMWRYATNLLIQVMYRQNSKETSEKIQVQ